MVWDRYDRWRRHPMLRPTHLKHVFPGFGTAAAIMGVYIVGEQVYELVCPPHHHDHDDHHAHGDRVIPGHGHEKYNSHH